MNILPKKRWHVRTRENIARVRKDEQEASAEAEEKKKRVLRAEKEARTKLLRERAHKKYGITIQKDKQQLGEPHQLPDNLQHVNFFEELEEGKIVTTKTNAEAEREEKEKREKYEKQIGYLTYLGQDTVETTGNIPWYEKVPDHHSSSSYIGKEEYVKSKILQDPLTVIRKYLPTETENTKRVTGSTKKKSSILEYQSILKTKDKKRKKKSKKKAKKRRKSSSSSSDDSESESCSDEESKEREKTLHFEKLRSERLRREKKERERTEALLNKVHGKTPEMKEEPTTPGVQQKYNSQYNPELAKQNYSKSPWSR